MKDMKERLLHLATTIPGALIILGALGFLGFLIHAGHATVSEIALIIAGLVGGGAAVGYKKKPESGGNAK